MSADWTPLIVAAAGLIVAITPGVASLIQARANGKKLDTIQTQTNGSLTTLQAHTATLEQVLLEARASGAIPPASAAETESAPPGPAPTP